MLYDGASRFGQHHITVERSGRTHFGGSTSPAVHMYICISKIYIIIIYNNIYIYIYPLSVIGADMASFHRVALCHDSRMC